ncbi:hypothetical protein MMC13_001813 [Lambiella insularis]|nr:hypothetical protein [Lambiella insularis]
MAVAVLESRVFAETNSAYYGKVKLPLLHLQYENDSITGTRPLDPQNVKRLRKIYELEGCHRLEPEHHVPVLIERSVLEGALSATNLQIPQLRESQEPRPLHLGSDVRLTCLYGKHRLEAAKQHFEPCEKWWIVDLYSHGKFEADLCSAKLNVGSDLPDSARVVLREEYSNSKNFGDGEIYRYIRLYQKYNDKKGAKKWLARLSESKRSDILKLNRMAAKSRAMARFRKQLDSLIPYIGLWSALQIGTFHRLLTLRCPEELTSYLKLVYETWHTIVNGDLCVANALDVKTVELLQGKALAFSSADEDAVRENFTRGLIFPTVKNLPERANLLARICSLQHRIPSLHTFLEDTKYLEPCAKIMKSLLPPTFRGSIRKAFKSRQSGVTVIDVEWRQESDITSSTASLPHTIAIGYRQLWLFAMRHFPELTPLQPRKDPGRAKPNMQGRASHWWYRLGLLAAGGGFQSEEIKALVQSNPDVQMTMEFLLNTRPAELYYHNEASCVNEVQRICTFLGSIGPREAAPVEAFLSCDSTAAMGLAERCGRPFEQSFLQDKRFLFLNYIYNDKWQHTEQSQWQQIRKSHVTSLAIKRDTFRAFFGNNLDGDLDDAEMDLDDAEIDLDDAEMFDAPSTGNASMPEVPFTVDNETRGAFNDSMETDTEILSTSAAMQSPTTNAVPLTSCLNSTASDEHIRLVTEPQDTSTAMVLDSGPRWWRQSFALPSHINSIEFLRAYFDYNLVDLKAKPFLFFRPLSNLWVDIVLPTKFWQHVTSNNTYWTIAGFELKSTALVELYNIAEQNGKVVVVTSSDQDLSIRFVSRTGLLQPSFEHLLLTDLPGEIPYLEDEL